MEKTQVNPWTWQEQFGYSQAWRIDSPGSLVFLAGQFAFGADGQLVGDGDFEAQCRQTFENMRVVLDGAGASFDSLVRVNVYITERENFDAYMRIRDEYVSSTAPPASTGIVVKSLAEPEMLIEIDAVAAV